MALFSSSCSFNFKHLPSQEQFLLRRVPQSTGREERSQRSEDPAGPERSPLLRPGHGRRMLQIRADVTKKLRSWRTRPRRGGLDLFAHGADGLTELCYFKLLKVLFHFCDSVDMDKAKLFSFCSGRK